MSYKSTELLHLDEIDAFVDLGHVHQQECEPDLGFDEIVARANVWSVMSDMSRAKMNMWVVRKDDIIVGYAIGTIHQYMFSTAKLASLVIWYVLPQHRKTPAAFKLLVNFENWAKLQGVRRIEIGAARESGGNTTEVNRMFTKRGFRQYGELFFRDLRG